MCTISIITPTRNRSAYLMEAIDSVRQQSFADWEMVVVDDGSTDNTNQVIHSLADERIRYHYQSHKGRSQACNHALALARGQYITFLDDDDLYHPRKLEIQLEYLKSHAHTDMVVSGAQTVDSNRRPLRRCQIVTSEMRASLEHFLFHHGILMGNFLLRRDVLSGLDRWFDPSAEPAADMDLFIRIFLAGFRVDYTPEIVFCYRLYENKPAICQFDRSYRRALDRMFAFEGLSKGIFDLRPRVLAYAHLLASCRAYALGQTKVGQFNLLRAAMLDKNTVEERLAEVLARYASCVKEGPDVYYRFVHDNRPAAPAFLDHVWESVLDGAAKQ